MKLYARVLNIRKHKNVTFMDCFTNENIVRQLMFNNSDDLSMINQGDLLQINGEISMNKYNKEIIKVKNILSHTKSYEWDSGKNIQNSTTNAKNNIFVNARNGGSQVNLFYLKKKVLEQIRQILISDSFIDLTNLTNVLEVYKNGSNVIPMEIKDRKPGETKYLKMSHENQLKQACAILLNSVFCMEKSFRNMGEDSNHRNELYTLELVSLSYKLDDMIHLLEKMDELARKIFEGQDKVKEDFVKKLEVVNYNDYLKKGKSLQDVIEDVENVLIVNYPILSPYVKGQTESRLYVRKGYVAHFYEDENDYEKIRTIEKQQAEAGISIGDEEALNYFKWGLPETYSLGFGLDRWLQLSTGESNINAISNPLGLNYIKKRR